ncbi:hypothetical protein GJAV_G00267110 [Gymnothorax javanicus]|nr:hypothetical protein GJAV_G00267110 [Gymnothorax javanicus]
MNTKCIGRCVPMFAFAIIIDIAGLVLLLIGIFANLRLEGRFYGDFLIYTGAILIFLSLFWWIMWYTGNVEISYEEPDDKTALDNFVQLVRKFSERLSKGGLKTMEAGEKRIGGKELNGSVAVRAPARVRWENSSNSGYDNKGYDESLDSGPLEKTMELGTLKSSEALENFVDGKVERLL